VTTSLFPDRPEKHDTEHGRLCQRALSFLNNSLKCQIAVSEMSCGREIPDALGWRWDDSVLIECKVSRADFLRDKNKAFRKEGEKSLGKYRFYLCPPGVILPADLPPRWGLLYAEGRSVRKIVYPVGYSMNYGTWEQFRHEPNTAREMQLLVAIARRLRDGCPFIRVRLGMKAPLTLPE
jgi:hypothetical protein